MTLATSIDVRPLASTSKMWSGAAASGVLHLAIALFVVVGVPQLFQPEPPQLSVPVDIVNLDEVAELASLPAEQIGPVESAEESRPVEQVDEVARPQTAAPAPAVQPTPPRQVEAPSPEPVVQPETAAVPATEPASAAEARPAPAAPTPPSAVAEPEPAPAVEAAPQVAAVAPEPQTPQPAPEPAETQETPPSETAEPVPESVTAEPSEDQPLMAGVLPLPSPPRPEDAPKVEPEAEVRPAEPPPSPVRAEKPKEEPVDDLLAGVLRNVDKNLKPSVTEQQQQAVRSDAKVTQSVDLTRKAAALGQMIRGQMQRCWRIDPGARSAEQLRVSVRVRLKPDGSLAAPPEFQNVGQLANSAYYRAAAESARRAILDCQPFRLPQEDYALWQDLILNFDPREMF